MEPQPGTKADPAPRVRFHERHGTVPFDLAMKVHQSRGANPARNPLPNWRGGALASRLAAVRPDGPVATVARWLGFVLLAGLGLLIIGGVVLLPATARYHMAQYERACLETKNANDEALILAYERLAQDIPHDPVLAKRIAMREFGFLPQDEVVLPAVLTSAGNHAELITAERQPLPDPPDAWLLATASKVTGPVKRTVFMLLGIALIAAAVTLTTPWADRRPDACA